MHNIKSPKFYGCRTLYNEHSQSIGADELKTNTKGNAYELVTTLERKQFRCAGSQFGNYSAHRKSRKNKIEDESKHLESSIEGIGWMEGRRNPSEMMIFQSYYDPARIRSNPRPEIIILGVRNRGVDKDFNATDKDLQRIKRGLRELQTYRRLNDTEKSARCRRRRELKRISQEPGFVGLGGEWSRAGGDCGRSRARIEKTAQKVAKWPERNQVMLVYAPATKTAGAIRLRCTFPSLRTFPGFGVMPGSPDTLI
ncbi:hypothetical protein B0H17DRAFT_1144523 [Mycena rosella]|uniref:Uncharacterized protein n=1 Tax=Mycena rosella TaxID=1033263 RepID=A0AAD7CSS5_MYCRO|nr:hypothetical protein B0H17DRAFT_1144523 [Mycena rosella]